MKGLVPVTLVAHSIPADFSTLCEGIILVYHCTSASNIPLATFPRPGRFVPVVADPPFRMGNLGKTKNDPLVANVICTD